MSNASRVPVDELLLARHLPDFDYADSFTAQASGTPAAREWARLTLAGGSDAVRNAFGKAVWGGILGFSLAPADAPDTLVGWRIIIDEPSLFVMATDGRLMEGRMIFVTDGARVTWTTSVRYHSPRARRIWAVMQHGHRRIAPRVLGSAAGALARRSALATEPLR